MVRRGSLSAWLPVLALACTAPAPGVGANPRAAGGRPSGSTTSGCGNGRIDTDTSEECDGADFGAATCQTIRLGEGALACSSSCDIDTSGCNPCTRGPRVVACMREPISGGSPQDLALATTDAEIVLAWAGPAGVRLARYGANLALIEEVTIEGGIADKVALARSASGYVLAFGAADGVHVQSLDASAHPRARARVVPDATRPGLVAAAVGGPPRSGPLFTWVRVQGKARTFAAAVLGDDAKVVAPEVELGQVPGGFSSDAAFTGSRFLVAWDGNADGRITLLRIGLGGTVEGNGRDIGPSRGNPRLAFHDNRGWLVDYDPENGISRTPIDSAGALLGPSEMITASDHSLGGDVTSYTPYGSVIASRGESVLLLNLVIVDGHPSLRAPRHPWDREFSSLAVVVGLVPGGYVPPNWPDWIELTREPVAGYVMAPFGRDAIVAWRARRSERTVTLARLTP